MAGNIKRRTRKNNKGIKVKLGWEVSKQLSYTLGQQIDHFFQLAELDNTIIDLEKPITISIHNGMDESVRVFSVDFEQVS